MKKTFLFFTLSLLMALASVAFVQDRFLDDTTSGNITYDLERVNITVSFNLSSEMNITNATFNLLGLKNGSLANQTNLGDAYSLPNPETDGGGSRDSVGFGDLDNDTYLDIIFANNSAGSGISRVVHVAFFNPENGTWTVNQTGISGVATNQPSFSFVDVDNDSFTDVMVGSGTGTSRNATLYTWNFTNQAWNIGFPLGNATHNTSGMQIFRALDYNSDGIVDLASIRMRTFPAAHKNLTILQGNQVAPWNYTFVNVGQIFGDIITETDILAVDFNNQTSENNHNNKSIFIVSTTGSTVVMFEANSSAINKFNSPVNWTLSFPISVGVNTESNCRLAAAELNGTLPLEIIVVCGAQDSATSDEHTFVWVMKSNASDSRRFNSPQLIQHIDPMDGSNYRVADITVADWNNNGTPDIFLVPDSTVSDGGGIYFLENNVSNTVNYTNPYGRFSDSGTMVTYNQQIKWRDFDNDGDLDLFGGDGGDNMAIRKNYLYPSNVRVFINGSRLLFNYSNNFNLTQQVSLNNTFLRGLVNSSSYGWNNISINISSDSGKVILEYGSLNITWTDITKPRNFNNLTNTTSPKRWEYIHFNINVSDGANLSSTTFGWNGTTNSFLNDSVISFSTTTLNYSFSVDKQTNWSRGTKITWRQYANDSSGNWNISEMSFIIANTAPTVNNVLINNTPITSTRSANGSASYSDLDNDSQSAIGIFWFINGELNQTATNKTELLFGNYTTNDQLVVSVRYYDGFDWSGWSNSSTVFVGDASPPSVPWYQLYNLSINNKINNTINFTMNVTDVGGSNIQSINFSLNLSTNLVADKSLTIPASQKTVNVSYEIFKSLETLNVGSYNITDFRVCDSSQNCNTTTDALSFPNWRGLNFSVTTAPLPLATFELRYSNLNNGAGNTNNFTVRAIGDADITSINFSLNISDNSVIDRSMTIPTGQPNVNVSYEIFKSLETLNVGNYNVTNVRIADLSGNVNITTDAASFPSWSGFSFTVSTTPTTPTGGGGGGGGGGCNAGFTNVNGTCIPTSNVTANLTRAPRCGDTFCDAFAGEDIFSCPMDCPLNKVKASYLTCSDPAKPCFFKTQKVVAYAIGFIIGGGVLFLSVSKGGKGKDAVEKAKNWLRKRKLWKG